MAYDNYDYLMYDSDYSGDYGNEVGGVNLSIFPKSGIMKGETVIVTGVCNCPVTVYSLTLNFYINSKIVDSHRITTSIRPRTDGAFSFEFVLKEDIFSSFNYTSSEISYGVDFSINDSDKYYLEKGIGSLSSDFELINYHLNIQLKNFDLERCDIDGIVADDGEYIKFKNFKMYMNPLGNINNIKNSFITLTNSGMYKTITIDDKTKLSAIFSESGYTESSPTLIKDKILLGEDLEITLVFGPTSQADYFKYETVFPRAIALIHLSGAKQGGVAVGGFSSSNDYTPKFEVISPYESHFYGPAYFYKGLCNHTIHEYSWGNFTETFEYADGKIVMNIRRRYWIPKANWTQSGSFYYYWTPAITEANLPPDFLRTYFNFLYPPMVTGSAYAGDYGDGLLAMVGKVSNSGINPCLLFRQNKSEIEIWVNIHIEGYLTDWYTGPFCQFLPHSHDSTNRRYNITSSSVINASWPLTAAVDRNNATAWICAADDAQPWVQIELDVVLKNIVISLHATTATLSPDWYIPVNGKILGSNDGDQWTQIGELGCEYHEGIYNPSGMWSTEFDYIECNNSVGYSMVRIVITEKPDPNNWIHIGEIYISGDFEDYSDLFNYDNWSWASRGIEGPSLINPLEIKDLVPDPVMAKTDYVAMMSNIVIPIDEEQESIENIESVSQSPQSFESPSTEESTTIHSKKFDLVKSYYINEVWNKQMVKNAVDKWITQSEYQEIINQKKD